jgi:hypothetical protein
MSQPRRPEKPILTAGRRSTKSHGSDATLRAENRRLKDRVRQLENERDRDQETITAITAERDSYRKALHAWAREQFKGSGSTFSAKELDRLKRTTDVVPLADFIDELRLGRGPE